MARLDALDAKRPERVTGGAPPRGGRTASRWPGRWPRARSWSCAAPDAHWRPALNGRVLAIFPRLSALADRITIEPVMQDEPRYLREAMAPHGVQPEPLVVGVEPTAEEIERARSAAAAADATVLFLYDAHLYKSNRALLEAVQARREEAGGGADARSVGRGVPGARRRGDHRLRVAALPARRGDGAPADVTPHPTSPQRREVDRAVALRPLLAVRVTARRSYRPER